MVQVLRVAQDDTMVQVVRFAQDDYLRAYRSTSARTAFTAP
ncbi:MAG: hypothetical protein JWN53_836 [Gemmatimonadetes bacterium]|jgi:hypothetical protein|nr:hypothetical protein [Gemmatimonadota bacterium]